MSDQTTPDPTPTPTPDPAPAPAPAPTPTRYVLGPGFGYDIAPPAPTPGPTPAPEPAKADVTVSVVSVSDNVLKVAVPNYDPATTNVLLQVIAFLVPSGTQVQQTPDFFLNSPFPKVPADLSGNLDALQKNGGEVDIPLPTAPEIAPGNYVGQIVLGFDK